MTINNIAVITTAAAIEGRITPIITRINCIGMGSITREEINELKWLVDTNNEDFFENLGGIFANNGRKELLLMAILHEGCLMEMFHGWQFFLPKTEAVMEYIATCLEEGNIPREFFITPWSEENDASPDLINLGDNPKDTNWDSLPKVFKKLVEDIMN